MKILKSTAIMSAALLAITTSFSSGTIAHNTNSKNLIYTNATVYTQNINQPQANAFVVKDGKFVFVGSDKDAKKFAGKNSQTVDLKKQFVLPALIDSHTHPGLVAVTANNKDMGKYSLPNTSKEDLYAYLRNVVAKENPDAKFLMIGNWSNSLFGVKGPDRKDIDDIFPNTAVVLADTTGHSYWLNTAALNAFGIDDNTPNLKDNLSFFVKDETGRKTGWVKEFALFPYLDMFAGAQPEMLKEGLQEFLGFLSSKGVTTVMDAGTFGAEEAVYQAVQQLEKEGKLPVRYEATHHIYMPQQKDDAVKVLLDFRKKYEGDLLKFNTIKIHYDGVAEINTAALLEDYNNEPGNKGGILLEENELKDLLLEMAPHKLNLHLHTVGDRSIRTALNAMEAAQKEYGGKLPVELTLSHLEVVHPDDIKRFKQLGVHANFTPHWLGGAVADSHNHETLGEERILHTQPVKSFINTGANFTFSSDVVVAPVASRGDPFLGIQIGITRQEPSPKNDAHIFGLASERASIDEMITGYTINNAKQLGLTNTIGSIEVGKDADFIVLPKNIYKSDTYSIKDIQPTNVYFQGKIVYPATK